MMSYIILLHLLVFTYLFNSNNLRRIRKNDLLGLVAEAIVFVALTVTFTMLSLLFFQILGQFINNILSMIISVAMPHILFKGYDELI